MIVEHQIPEDQLNTVDPNPPEEETWFNSINSLTYGVDETSILGFTSNSDDSLRFTVTDPQGQCIIGGADECLINESTRGKRGGLESIPYGDQILRIRYSGADNVLEKFSITSIDPIVGQWNISLESEDGFVQQAYASEDSVVKIKYRYHSEIVTLFSQ